MKIFLFVAKTGRRTWSAKRPRSRAWKRTRRSVKRSARRSGGSAKRPSPPSSSRSGWRAACCTWRSCRPRARARTSRSCSTTTPRSSGSTTGRPQKARLFAFDSEFNYNHRNRLMFEIVATQKFVTNLKLLKKIFWVSKILNICWFLFQNV